MVAFGNAAVNTDAFSIWQWKKYFRCERFVPLLFICLHFLLMYLLELLFLQ